jgi:16S rRNA (guanine527-N7)-methyltransferase
MIMHPLFAALKAGSDHMNLGLSDQTLGRLLQYQDQLALWNKAYNLTAIRQPKEMLVRHLLDSLSILPHLPAGRLLDVGTGGGLPGMVIALCQPERECVLLDSNGKKIRFLRQIAADLQVSNAKPVQVRIEDEQARRDLGQFDVVTSRAFAALTDFVRDCTPYLNDTGVLAAMKALLPTEEMAQLGTFDQQVIALNVPYLDEARHLIMLTPQR